MGFTTRRPTGQPAGDEPVAPEVGQGDERIHVAMPGSPRPVDGEHRGDRSRLGPRISIAGVDDRRERDWQTDAVLARCAVPEERRGGADQAVVVQRLHDRCPGRAGCAVNRGRQERQEVVDVDDVRPDGPGTIRDSGGGRGRPHGPHRQSDTLGRRRPIGNGVIVDDEAVYSVAVACEELGLGVDDRVLSAGLAVAVVDDEDGSDGFELGNGHVIRRAD